MKIKRLIIYLLPIIFSIILISCKDDDANSLDTLKVTKNNISFLATGTLSKTVEIQSKSGTWMAKALEETDWCQISKEEDGLLRISVSENIYTKKRTSKIEIKLGDQKDSITVEQLGTNIDILTDKQTVNIKMIGDVFDLTITTNGEYEYTLPEWIKEAKASSRSDDLIDYQLYFYVSPNNKDKERQGVIEFFDLDKTISKKVLVIQKGLDNYSGTDLTGVYDDIKLAVANATASSEHAKGRIELSHDEDYKTIYHSNWSNSGNNYFPIELVYNLDNAETLNYFIYYPINDNSNNGNFKEVEVYGLFGDNNDYIKIADYDFKGSSQPTRVTFDQSIEKPKSIKFIIKSGSGDGQGFASCSEMEFYQFNSKSFDYSTIFSDQTCSELKPGVTLENIEQCQYPFYKNLAYFIFNNKYDKEFRVATFNAYSHPDIQAKINKTNQYSLMDNPTGIYVRENEEVVILADDLKDAKLSILIQNLDKPGGDGYGGPTFPISSGVNKFTAPSKGLLYVMYHNNSTDHIDTYKKLPPVKLHFATGSVNGYFNSQKHTEADWKRLLDNTTSEYFDVLGKYAHLTYPVNTFKTYTSSGLELIKIYDKIVYDQMDFMGLFKYDTPQNPRVFRNRMYFNVMYHSYMYSTSYRTAYNESTLSSLANVLKLPKDGIWGPAHEVGHSNQTKPGFKWVGMTEVTNNVHSQYIQTNFGNISRLQGENLGEGRNRFEKAMTNMFPTSTLSYIKEPDVFCKLVPLWQLQLYCSWVLGNDDIYKDIYEDVRLNPDKGGPGMNQMWFAYRASKASGYDLTEFFDKWGFFVPIDENIKDYWVERMTITPELANKVKMVIKELNLPKPKHAIEYITDRSTEEYKSNTKVTSGTFSISKKYITTTGCENIVAIEVFDNKKLVFVSTRPKFTLINELNNADTVVLEAVSADGSRIKLTRK